jgi:CheY-like chemotaxis protein
MDNWQQFREELQDALGHLFDPDYQPSDLMMAVTGCDPEDGAGPVQSAIIQVIADLAAAQGGGEGGRASRMVDILYKHFVLGLTQEETAERVELSVRQLRRTQREATHMLARLLWEDSLAREAPASASSDAAEGSQPGEAAAGSYPLDWRSQVKQDVASLQTSAPGAVSDVAATIREAVELQRVLASRRGTEMIVDEIEPNLVAAIHPSALRQIVILAAGQLVHDSSTGRIEFRAEEDDGEVSISVRGPAPATRRPPGGDLIQEIVAAPGGSVEVGLDGDVAFLHIRVPAVGKVTVLVVDDNSDLVHFYRRSTTGTRYRIVHEPTGLGAFDAVETFRPDIIVLDVMLPDIDGWTLLTHLHEQVATRSIPVVVCSVIREEELALALGAVSYLPKPVHGRQLTEALDRALRRG